MVSLLVQSRVSSVCTQLSSTRHPSSRAEASTAGAPERPFVLHRLTRILLRGTAIWHPGKPYIYFPLAKRSFQTFPASPLKTDPKVLTGWEQVGWGGAVYKFRSQPFVKASKCSRASCMFWVVKCGHVRVWSWMFTLVYPGLHPMSYFACLYSRGICAPDKKKKTSPEAVGAPDETKQKIPVLDTTW